ncbi:MarR family winged helix-turn-helix transcriptional regulator [Dactylosporangium cerinum]|uniref:MarR family winged helix-turn-helix transcriptional regulator n=1 Tax=Dactylosporangium cerinum TaxID=1434730 RepID=A0ABV9W638_9ACTN
MASRPQAVVLGELLGRSWRTFSRLGQARFAESGLSAARVRLLLALAAEPDSRMGDLARSLGLTARALTPLTDSLAEEGLVERVVDPADRRAFRLALTELGAGEAERIGALQAQISDEIFAGLTPAQRRDLERLLLAFVASTGGEGPPDC